MVQNNHPKHPAGYVVPSCASSGPSVSSSPVCWRFLRYPMHTPCMGYHFPLFLFSVSVSVSFTVLCSCFCSLILRKRRGQQVHIVHIVHIVHKVHIVHIFLSSVFLRFFLVQNNADFRRFQAFFCLAPIFMPKNIEKPVFGVILPLLCHL